MTDLPPGWEWTTLGEVGRYVNGRGFKKTEWAKSGRPIIRIQNLTGTSDEFNYFEGDVDLGHVAEPGDLLVSWAASLGVHEWAGPEAVINQHIFKVESSIDKRFHRAALSWALSRLVEASHGTGMVHVTRPIFEATPIPMPPLAEQARLVDILELTLSNVQSGRDQVGNARSRLAGLRQAIRRDVLAANSTSDGRLSDFVSKVEAGKSFGGAAPPASIDEWGVVRVSAMTWGEFDASQNKRVPNGLVNPSYEVREGDILVSRANTGEYVGAPVLVGSVRPKLLLSDKSLRIIPKPGVNRRWLLHSLASPEFRSYVSTSATGTKDSMRNISQSALLAGPVQHVKPEDQEGCAAAIDERLACVDRLEGAIAGAMSRADYLERALVNDAFAGRLTPQDPDDEPASVLLDRIRAERAAAKLSSRSRRPAPVQRR